MINHILLENLKNEINDIIENNNKEVNSIRTSKKKILIIIGVNMV